MQARSIMNTDIEYVEPHTPIGQALLKLFELDIRHLPVLRDGELVGILSDRDLKHYIPSLFEAIQDRVVTASMLGTKVIDVMQSDVITVAPTDEITDLLDIFIDEKVGAVPVVDPIEGRLLGIISYIDVLKQVRDALSGEETSTAHA